MEPPLVLGKPTKFSKYKRFDITFRFIEDAVQYYIIKWNNVENINTNIQYCIFQFFYHIKCRIFSFQSTNASTEIHFSSILRILDLNSGCPMRGRKCIQKMIGLLWGKLPILNFENLLHYKSTRHRVWTMCASKNK